MKRVVSFPVILFLGISMLLLLAHVEAQTPPNPSATQLTTHPYRVKWPEWSRDGSKIVYQAYDSSGWYRHIWIMNADGSSQTQLTFGNVVDQFPTFSSDGLKILFSRYGLRPGHSDLMVMDVDGSNLIRLTFGPAGYGYHKVHYSIDDQKVVCVYYTPGTSYVATMNLSDMVPHPSTLGHSPRWESDDREIIFTTPEPNQQIAVMNSDGSNLQLITNCVGRSCARGDLSPDGKSIALDIVESDGITQDIYMMTKEGKYLTRLTYNERSFGPVFSPQGDKILFISMGNIWVMRTPQILISATTNIDPDTLNLKSNGQWITAYVELPEGHCVSEIDVCSILLNGSIGVDPEAPTAIGDHDMDGIPDLMVKFDRAAVIALLGTYDYGEDTGKSVDVALVITGNAAGTPFEGVDTTRVLLKG